MDQSIEDTEAEEGRAMKPKRAKADPICNWCGHPKREHYRYAASMSSSVSDMTGCLHWNDKEINGTHYCPCSAERGRARKVKP